MATAVPETEPTAQFLFTASSSSGLISGFKVNNDGSLAPAAGSPFASKTPARAVAALDNDLIVGDQAGLKLFRVDRETGAIQQMDALEAGPVSEFLSGPAANTVVAVTPAQKLLVRIVEKKLQAIPAGPWLASAEGRALPPAVLDASGNFMFTVDSRSADLMAFRVEAGKLSPLSPASYPLPGRSSSITLVKP